ncbi:MAG: efflux RND transporter periplasmic adaptor subunit [Bacteroidota bacterium]
MKKYILPIFVLLAITLTACGKKEAQGLEAKKKELQTKKNELRELSKVVAALEAEIQESDPEFKAKKKIAPVTVKKLEGKTFRHFVNVNGMIEANKNITVSPMVGGRITRIYVREGQNVRPGQLLAQIDDAIIRSSIGEVETQLDLAKVVFEKQERLWKQEIGTEIQFLTAKNQVEALESRLVTLKEQLNMNKVKAPISGNVDEIMPKVGEMVSPGFPAFSIVNNRDLSIKADVPESYAPFINKGKEVEVHFPILEKSITSKVSLVGQSINPLNRSFKVEVKLPSSSDYKPNMFGEISVNDRTIEDAITIPLYLVQKTMDESFVFVAQQEGEGWVARRKSVTTGLISKDEVQITEGLKAGDQLITVGYKDLSEGQQVSMEETQTEVATN